jgi:hypothetical protein
MAEGSKRLVADEQQEFYAQVMHKMIDKCLNNLWAICGSAVQYRKLQKRLDKYNLNRG